MSDDDSGGESPGDDRADAADADAAEQPSTGEERSSTGTSETKYCVSCGRAIPADAEICPECGVNQARRPESGGRGRSADEKYCPNCDAVINRDAELCPECGVRQPVDESGGEERLVAALLAILLGGLGIHKFYLGDNKMGVLYLCFFWTGIPMIVGIIEGIIYLTKTDEEFRRRYVKN